MDDFSHIYCTFIGVILNRMNSLYSYFVTRYAVSVPEILIQLNCLSKIKINIKYFVNAEVEVKLKTINNKKYL